MALVEVAQTLAMDCRALCAYFAQSAREGRYDDMVQAMEAACEGPSDLLAKERLMLWFAFKHAAEGHRSAWRKFKAAEQREAINNGSAQKLERAKQACAQVEKEFQQISDAFLSFVDRIIMRKALSVESQVFVWRIRADYHRYVAEVSTGDAKAMAIDSARMSYALAQCIAEGLEVTHPIRLSLVLNYAVFMYEILRKPHRACKMARAALVDAVAQLHSIPEDIYQEVIELMRDLGDNLNLWSDEQEEQ